MNVGDWLRSLGLIEYEPAFRDNQIDGEVLLKLTGDDLKELGVASIGHRRKLLSAIAQLSGTSAEPTGVTQAIRVDPPSHAAAERRQLTVMFCDLVGSAAISARLDPEDIREMIAAYHQCCATLIEGAGGFVAKYMGDGVLGYFGYPQAHEHDAERAVRAGLAIVEAAPTLHTAAGVPLHVRVGIATGIVIVGDLLGSGEAQEREVVGGTLNLAARLQGIAEPDSVVIAEGTRKLLGELFELVDLGPQKLKNVAGMTPAFAALRESSQANRFEALHPEGLAALVGREAECEHCFGGAGAKAKAGQGQVVLISGEAGIGKSRLTAEFLERLPGEPHTRLRYFCSPQHTDSALYPIIGHIERAANFAREDDAKTRLDKLDVVLSRSSMSGEDAALVAEILSLPNDGRYPVLDLAPHQRRQRTLAALARRIEGIARETPVLMVYEDAHWADPSSLEAIDLLVDKIGTLRLLLFLTFRPEFVPPWAGRPHVTALTINRLAPREVTALIDRVAGDRSLAANIRQDIVERADGIPLFVEEMTKAVLEAEGEGAAARICGRPLGKHFYFGGEPGGLRSYVRPVGADGVRWP
jgi:class 3 adenylate cyclase